jgi:hypothetical protein
MSSYLDYFNQVNKIKELVELKDSGLSGIQEILNKTGKGVVPYKIAEKLSKHLDKLNQLDEKIAEEREKLDNTKASITQLLSTILAGRVIRFDVDLPDPKKGNKTVKTYLDFALVEDAGLGRRLKVTFSHDSTELDA